MKASQCQQWPYFFQDSTAYTSNADWRLHSAWNLQQTMYRFTCRTVKIRTEKQCQNWN